MKTYPYNPFDFLETQEEINEYMADAFLDNDPRLFLIALGHLARKKGMTQIAKETGLNREGLYRSLSGDGNPGYIAIAKIIRALGLDMVPRLPV